ncbi:MAG: hypothetical protein HRT35_32230 [Algicola sp.]|nr:hypothetical protein [Algicola sp.]
MKNSKKIWFISCAGVCALAVLGYQYFGLECTSCEPAKVAQVNTQSANVESTRQLAVPATAGTQHSMKVEKPAETDEYLGASNNASQPQSGKKHYDDDWCIAKDELSESDYNFAQTQLQDWDEFQGKARFSSPSMSHADELMYPNNNYIESYEALPLEQLESLAVKGDKWAMVTFVQHPQANMKVKDEVAKQLLVQGASYYALQELIFNSIVAAEMSFERADGRQAAADHVIEALAYAYWGLEHYNEGSLGTFIALTSVEPFKTKFPLELVLANSEKKIENSLKKLTNSIQQARAEAGIDIPQAPSAVQKSFAKHIAIRESISKKHMDLLRSLNIANNNRIQITPCVNKHLADLKEKTQKY